MNFQGGIRQAPVRRRKSLKRGGFTLLSLIKSLQLRKRDNGGETVPVSRLLRLREDKIRDVFKVVRVLGYEGKPVFQGSGGNDQIQSAGLHPLVLAS